MAGTVERLNLWSGGSTRWAAAFLVAGLTWAVLAEAVSVDGGEPVENAVLDGLAGASFTVAGAVALLRRPGNRIGPLMLAVGFTWFFGNFTAVHSAWPWAFAYTFEAVSACFIVWLILAYPTGFLPSKRQAGLVVAVAVTAVLSGILRTLSAHFLVYSGCTWCVRNPVPVIDNEGFHAAVEDAFDIVGAALAVVVFATVVARWHRATPAERRALRALWIASGLLALSYVAILLDQLLTLGANARPTFWSQHILVAAVPIVFLAGLLRLKLARGAVGRLLLEIEETPSHGALRNSLAAALRDPSIEVAYAVDSGGFVDADGHGVTLPGPGSGRAITYLDREGGRLGALVHDPVLVEQPELLSSVVAAARLALTNERLQALVRAQLEEVRASRLRIIEAADTERRRIERNLHDGAQQRLIGLRIAIQLARGRAAATSDGSDALALDEIDSEVLETIEELRRLAHGLHPAVLEDGSLADALDGLVLRAGLPVTVEATPDRPLAASVEAAAYYVVAESLSNAMKHSGATQVTIEARCQPDGLHVRVADDGEGGASIEPGGGLAGLRDRVEALRGQLDVVSSPRGGTVVHAAIPCE
jgi:signal transduction histidine kinase